MSNNEIKVGQRTFAQDDQVGYTPEDTSIGPVPLTGGKLAEGHVYTNPFQEGDIKEDEQPTIAPVNSKVGLEKISKFIGGINKDNDKNNLVKLVYGSSVLTSMGGQYLQDGVDKTKSAQYIEYNDRKVGCNTVNIDTGGSKLKGSAAINRVMSKMHTGNEKIQRLPKSGFNVVIGYISEREKLSLQYKLINLVYDVGIETGGLVLSYDDAHVQVAITDFVIDHIVNTNVEGWTKQWLYKNILISDLPLLHTACLAGMYPNGYPFYRNCAFSDFTDASCDWSTLSKNIESEKDIVRLDFGLISMYCVDKLTTEMRRQLSVSEGVTQKDVEEYQAKSNQPFRIKPIYTNGDSKFSLELKCPNYGDYKRESNIWLSDMANLVDSVLLDAPVVSEKEDYNRRVNTYNEFLDRVRLEYYSSWVDSIVEVVSSDTEHADEEIIYGGDTDDDQETKLSILGVLAANDDAVEAAMAAISKYTIDCTYGFTGLPDWECPSCKRGQRTKNDTLQGVIFFNVTSYFFDLMKKELG
jgi:hypothetical protein